MKMIMTESRRIILNTLATYGRTMFALTLGLFSSRWVLQGLGKNDLGLFGIVGSLIVVIGLLNTVLRIAVSRYYAYTIGQARKMPTEEGRELMMQWFNAAFSLHVIFPAVLLAIGYPIGVYAIHHWLVIPPERITACIWILRISVLAAFINMCAAPFLALYSAYQLIAELSIFGIIQTVLTFGFVYSMLSYSGDRLIYYGIGTAGISCLILGIQVTRAICHFDACRFRFRYFFDWQRFRTLFAYASWELFSCLGDMLRSQGATFVINRHFGLGVNAAYGIANQVSSYTTSLSSAMIGALAPAVTSAEGSGDRARMINLSFQCCKFGALMILVFCIPLISEMDEVLHLWLVNPPEWTNVFCRCILFAFVIHKLGWGHHLAISAHGKIGLYHFCIGTTSAMTLCFMLLLIACGYGVASIGYGFIVSFLTLTIERVLFARQLIGMSLRIWILHVVFPVTFVAALSYALASCTRLVFNPSFLRVCLTTFVSGVVLCGMSWRFVLCLEEREFILAGVRKIWKRFLRKGT